MKKTLISLALAATLINSGLSTASAADENYAIVQQMTEFGIDAATQAAILDNLARGIIPLSDVAGSNPISQTEKIVDGYQLVTSTYADGSVKQVMSEVPTNPRLRSAYQTGCWQYAYTGYTNYRNCSIVNVTTLVTMGFLADYTIYGGTYNDAIDRVYSTSFTCRGGTCSDTNLVIQKAKESTSGPADARMSLTYNIYLGLGSSTYSLDLQVGSNKATVIG